MSGMDRAALVGALPYARRYARALTGAQASGDAVVADALRQVLADADAGGIRDPRIALYAAIGRQVLAQGDTPDPGMSMQARMLLLLTSLEEMPLSAAAQAAGMSPEEASTILADARGNLLAGASARVLIIEDEPIIALDIQELVERCGHSVVGIAASEVEAVAIARAEQPSLVLADINLGSGGDGTSAVASILRHVTAPVIFVTAHPERLLTGEVVEPAFVITKPFDPTVLAVATYQAVTRGVRPL